ncbi:MAG: MetQ/NlpA family ABC transporter substrate-binding protein [Bacillota bacterium]
MKRLALLLTLLLSLALLLSGCAAKAAPSASNTGSKTVKLGLTGTDSRVWKDVQARAAKEGIKLELIYFSDYVRPNQALAEGEINANAFQTKIYFDDFKAKHGLDLTSIGDTVIAPMGIYSQKVKSVTELKDGAKIGIPNDATNGGRALVLLQSAGLIKLRPGAGNVPTKKDIAENPKKFEIIELVATQIPRSLPDLDAAAINNGVAVQAGMNPVTDSIYIEDFKSKDAEPYVNIIAARTKDKDDATLKRIVALYQTEETKKALQDEFKGATIPAWK